MNYVKVITKGLFGLLTGLSASLIANPEAIVTLSGADNAVKIGAIVALISAFSNWFKHRGD